MVVGRGGRAGLPPTCIEYLGRCVAWSSTGHWRDVTNGCMLLWVCRPVCVCVCVCVVTQCGALAALPSRGCGWGRSVCVCLSHYIYTREHGVGVAPCQAV